MSEDTFTQEMQRKLQIFVEFATDEELRGALLEAGLQVFGHVPNSEDVAFGRVAANDRDKLLRFHLQVFNAPVPRVR